jgi:hypothetical protein
VPLQFLRPGSPLPPSTPNRLWSTLLWAWRGSNLKNKRMTFWRRRSLWVTFTLWSTIKYPGAKMRRVNKDSLIQAPCIISNPELYTSAVPYAKANTNLGGGGVLGLGPYSSIFYDRFFPYLRHSFWVIVLAFRKSTPSQKTRINFSIFFLSLIEDSNKVSYMRTLWLNGGK